MPDTWRDEALCQSHPEIDWIPDPPAGRPRRETLANLTAARAVCAVCPVSDDCLEDALTSPHTFGIRAGTIDAQRRKLRKGRPVVRQRQSVAQCGTDSGYHRHRRIGTTPCAACRAAHAAYDARCGYKAKRTRCKACGERRVCTDDLCNQCRP